MEQLVADYLFTWEGALLLVLLIATRKLAQYMRAKENGRDKDDGSP